MCVSSLSKRDSRCVNKTLFNFSLLQMLEKICRVEHFLDTADLSWSRSDAEVMFSFRRTLKQIRIDWDQLLAMASNPDNIKFGGPQILLRRLGSCSNSLVQLHLQLSYVKGHWTPPETESFVDAVLSGTDLERAKRPSVVLSDIYLFEEIDFGSMSYRPANSAKISSPALLLPKLEYENPLQWAMLIHEMGHSDLIKRESILSKEDLSSICGKDNLRGQEVLENWLDEIFCDLLGLHLLGPAYIASFVELITVIGSEGILEAQSHSHPHPRIRICTMQDLLQRKNILCPFGNSGLFSKSGDLATFYYELYEECCGLQTEYCGSQVPEGFEPAMNVTEFTTLLDNRVERFVPIMKHVPPFDHKKLSYLLTRLKHGIPIGSYSPVQVNDGNEPALAAIKNVKRLISRTTPDKKAIAHNLSVAVDRIRETPCTVAEILNAGWLYKCEHIYGTALAQMEHSFSASNQDSFISQLFSLDAILRNSIETSYLTGLFLQGFKETEQNEDSL